MGGEGTSFCVFVCFVFFCVYVCDTHIHTPSVFMYIQVHCNTLDIFNVGCTVYLYMYCRELWKRRSMIMIS